MTNRKTVPVYQRYDAAGNRRQNRSGVEAALKAGGDPASDAVVWIVDGATLAGLVPQAEFDIMRDTAGRWWVVKESIAVGGGMYELKCDRWKEGAE